MSPTNLPNALPKNLSINEIEEIYDTLAESIDNAGEKNETKMLTKLALILGNQLGDKTQVIDAIQLAGLDL